jgi:hypothetical protein
MLLSSSGLNEYVQELALLYSHAGRKVILRSKGGEERSQEYQLFRRSPYVNSSIGGGSGGGGGSKSII